MEVDRLRVEPDAIADATGNAPILFGNSSAPRVEQNARLGGTAGKAFRPGRRS
jgi:hypothetical protein